MKRNTESETPPFDFRLDAHSGVPVYRQLIDQVLGAVASRALASGDQLPTVRQVAVDLAINPNTVQRAYREMEIRGTVDTQQGTGTFIAESRHERSKDEHERQLTQLVDEFASRAGAAGFSLKQLVRALRERIADADAKTQSNNDSRTEHRRK